MCPDTSNTTYVYHYNLPCTGPSREPQICYDPHPYLVEGMRIRVTHGPLAGVEGILNTKKSVARLIVRIELILRAVAIDIDSSAVESLGW
jgi:hypothetical protein